MSRLGAILILVLGVPTVYLVVRNIQSSPSNVDSGAADQADPERKMLEARTLRAERQSIKFSDRIDELEAEVARWR